MQGGSGPLWPIGSDVVDAFDGLRREADCQGHMCGNGRQDALDEDSSPSTVEEPKLPSWQFTCNFINQWLQRPLGESPQTVDAR